jgi:hypothetical protein
MFTDDELRGESFIDTCALRFDGYLYQQNCGSRMGPDKVDFPELVDRVEKTLELYEDQLDNFAVFFALQRWLGKWGGETSSNDDPARVAYRFLFLHLYREEIPERFQWREQTWYTEWERQYKPYQEELAGWVRRNAILKAAKADLY